MAERLDDVLRGLIGQLPDGERQALGLRFGEWVDGHPPLGLAEAAAEMGVTREQLRQMEGRAIMRLRRMWDDRGGDGSELLDGGDGGPTGPSRMLGMLGVSSH